MIEQTLRFLQGGVLQAFPFMTTGTGARIAAGLDILFVTMLLVVLFQFIRRTRATNILLGLLLIGAGIVAARLLNLVTLNFLLTIFGILLIFATPILFQPELRRGLERLGRNRGFWHTGKTGTLDQATINTITSAVEMLQDQKCGALIVVERNTGLSEYVETGVRLDAMLEPSLLATLFLSDSSLHDGAVIVHDGRITAAACTLPLAENGANKRLGTRHRAALGISETSDALAIVISEERGKVSVAVDGRLFTVSSTPHLHSLLVKLTK